MGRLLFRDLIAGVKLLFGKDKELCAFIREITGYLPRHIELYKLALVHRSKPVKLPDGHWANNERLEFLGDAVLDAVVADYLYRRFPRKHEGFLTSTRAKIVQRESLNRIGRQLHIDAHMRTSTHTSSHNSYICGNTVEALVGAVYLDQGYKRCTRFIVNRIIKAHFDMPRLVHTDRNYKSQLIEWAQKHRVAIDYQIVDTQADSDNSPTFKTVVLLGGVAAGEGTGYTKKESHQAASRQALKHLRGDLGFRSRIISTAGQDANRQ